MGSGLCCGVIAAHGNMGESTSVLALVFFLFIHGIPLSQTQSERSFYYDRCAPSPCGNVTISFPFFSSEQFCGPPGYAVSCRDGIPRLAESPGRRYTIQAIYNATEDCIVQVIDTELVNQLASGDCGSVGGYSLPISLGPWGYRLTNSSLDASIIVYTCPKARTPLAPLPKAFVSYNACRGDSTLIYDNNRNYGPQDIPVDPGPEWSAVCNRSVLPATSLNLRNENGIVAIVSGGFVLQWPKQLQRECVETCQSHGGRCGFNDTTHGIVCFCSNGGNCTVPRDSTRNKRISGKVVIAVALPASVVVIMAVLVSIRTIYRRRVDAGSITNNGLLSILLGRKPNRRDMDAQEFIYKYKMTLPTQYSYPEIKKMTGAFKHKLGRGGYGNVFKGTSPNGIPVAVKVLQRSTGSISSSDGGGSNEDFFNEVATIGRIHHVNIIKLLGFCCGSSCRALVYEFMPCGSLADLLTKKNHELAAVEMLRIGVEIARGIEYLHQGCDSRILHLDIKPQNVLLSQHLHAKISDFGMAKSYSRKDSVVKLTGARGTVGYIAPEVFLRNLGGVSVKSDVYSYGMLLLEMALGGKNNYDKEAAAVPAHAQSSSGGSTAYFPDWVYDKLEKLDSGHGEEIVPVDTADGSDVSVLRTMVLVGLWCIQTRPIDRPSISEVLEMLTGKVQNIQVPPKPVMSSPLAELSPASTPIETGSFPFP